MGFYRGGLGLEVINDLSGGGYRWGTLGAATWQGAEVGLSQPHAGRSGQDGDALQELLAKGVLPMAVFATDDVDALFERRRATGAEALQGPSTSRMDRVTAPSATSRRYGAHQPSR